jgi:hypothetical protein
LIVKVELDTEANFAFKMLILNEAPMNNNNGARSENCFWI